MFTRVCTNVCTSSTKYHEQNWHLKCIFNEYRCMYLWFSTRYRWILNSALLPIVRPGQVDSQFIVPTHMCFQEHNNILIIHYSSQNNHLHTFPDSEQLFTAKITMQGTKGMAIYISQNCPKSSKTFKSFYKASENA